MRLGYLGPEGTFSEEAAHTSPAAATAELVALASIHDTVMAVHDGTVDRAVVPIENSLEGQVAMTLDTLVSEAADVRIVGEVVLGVSQCLIARATLAASAIERVLSHPQALAQCARYLREALPAAEIAARPSTADAVREVVATRAPWAALGTRRAAALNGGTVLAAGVEDEPGNATRFVWLARASPEAACAGAEGRSEAAGPMKTSLAFWGAGDDSPGWLVRCLSEFAFRGVNLTKIESRPLRGRLGHYRFFVDCAGSDADAPVAAAAAALRAHCEEIRILGSYPAAPARLETAPAPD